MINFQDKENVHPSMCSTPIIKKSTKIPRLHRANINRTPLTPMNINVKIKRSSPAEVEVLKHYINELNKSHSAELKEQHSMHEKNRQEKSTLPENTSLNQSSSKEIQCDNMDYLSCFSLQMQVNILQKKLMKSNIDRDKNLAQCKNHKSELDNIAAKHSTLQRENSELNKLITHLRQPQTCNGEDCASKSELIYAKQNYQILENSHKELELHVCHLATEVERKNEKMSEMFLEHKTLVEKYTISEKRCTEFESKVIKLEEELSKLQSTGESYEKLKKEFEELQHDKSKARLEMEFLIDERDTREVTLEEIYKQLTETRKEQATLRESNEILQEQYESLVVKSDELAKQYAETKELVSDTSEMCDFLRKKLAAELPGLCNKHNLVSEDYQIPTKCPQIIGDMLYILHAVDRLQDMAGSVSVNKETRKQVFSLKDDVRLLETANSQLRESLSSKTDRIKHQESYQKSLSAMNVEYSRTIESNEQWIAELLEQSKQYKQKLQEISDSNERYQCKIERQTEDLAQATEQLDLYDDILHTVKTRMLTLGSSLPPTLKVVLQQLV